MWPELRCIVPLLSKSTVVKVVSSLCGLVLCTPVFVASDCYLIVFVGVNEKCCLLPLKSSSEEIKPEKDLIIRMSEIYPLADKFDLSPRLKQNGAVENWMKTQMVLFGYNTKEFIYNKVAYIFPYADVTISKKIKLTHGNLYKAKKAVHLLSQQ